MRIKDDQILHCRMILTTHLIKWIHTQTRFNLLATIIPSGNIYLSSTKYIFIFKICCFLHIQILCDVVYIYKNRLLLCLFCTHMMFFIPIFNGVLRAYNYFLKSYQKMFRVLRFSNFYYYVYPSLS